MKRIDPIYRLHLLMSGLLLLLSCRAPHSGRIIFISRRPRIVPDYSDLIVPSNMAPLNFRILEKGKAYKVTFESENIDSFKINSKDPVIRIPLKSWKKLLDSNRGKAFQIQVEVLSDGQKWKRYRSFINHVAESPIDGYLVYRRLMPYHTLWGEMGIYQRNLENFSEVPLLLNRTIDNGCVNCHSFYPNDPERFILHVRGRMGSGMLVANGEDMIKVDTRTAFNQGHATFRSWHPNGEILAFSMNRFIQLFHATGETREVCDLGSDLMLYDVASHTLSTYPTIAHPDRMETYPCWSPDGKTLYFSSAPKIESYLSTRDRNIDAIYSKIQYDLQSISYDPAEKAWGEISTLLSSSEIGKSILQPKVSPDGRFLLVVMSDFGGFPIFNQSSDIHLMDIKTGRFKRPDINSDQTESSPSWSSNGRWFVFVSKRQDGLYAFPYICHVDEAGNVSKPFLVPQEDPGLYPTICETFNVPEFLTRPVEASWQALSRAILDDELKIRAKLDEKVQVDHVTGASVRPMWQQP